MNLLTIPTIAEVVPNYTALVHRLAEAYAQGTLTSWAQTELSLRQQLGVAELARMEAALPGWGAMVANDDGRTLTHVTCVLIGLFLLPEYCRATLLQQACMAWAALLHDIAKRVLPGEREFIHPFRSVPMAARILQRAGFPVTAVAETDWAAWTHLVNEATICQEGEMVADNGKLPNILAGIERLFGGASPAAHILQAILFHQSFSPIPQWPNPANLTVAEIKQYITVPLLPVLGAMLLADSEGWNLWQPEWREQFLIATRNLIADVAGLIEEG